MAVQNKSLEETLYNLGLLKENELQEIRQKMKAEGKSAHDVILEMGLVSDEILTKTKAILLDVPFINLEKAKIPPEILSIIPERISTTYKVIAFFKGEDGTLKVAMTNPADFQAIEYLGKKTGMVIEPYMALEQHIKTIQSEYHALEGEVTKALADVDNDDAVDVSTGGDVQDTGEGEGDIADAPVARVVNTVLEFAVKSHASDIHIEPMEKKTRVRYRMDGILREAITLPKQVHPAVVSRLKIMSRLKIDEKRIPQDGRFRVTVHGKDNDLRVSTVPTVFGEKIVMRVLDRSTSAPTLDKLGYRGQAYGIIKKNMKKPNGLILTTGPTGSGKSTSLFAILTELNTGEVNTMTLEDPVEYWIEGVNQVQINVQAGMTFASGLRAALRQDPDIIMVGEIRDHETAEMAIHAALTGHLVVSTLHTNSAAGAIPRFIDMGVEPFLLGSSLEAVIGQRLARKVCPDCQESYDAPPEVVEQIKRTLPELFDKKNPIYENLFEWYPKIDRDALESGKITLLRAAGCETCSQTGYHGRVGMYEVLDVTEKITECAIRGGSDMELSRIAKEEYQMITLIQDGYLKALEGLTTLQEAMRIAQN